MRTYTPAPAVAHKGLVQFHWAQACKAMGFKPPMDAMVAIRIKVLKPLPASAPKWMRAIVDEYEAHGDLGFTEPPPASPSRGDVDNYQKLVQDALQGLAYHNDSQVFDGRCTKHFGATADTWVEVSYYRWQSFEEDRS